MAKLPSFLIKSPLVRGLGIAFLNILFVSKRIKSWFEKHIFNPYEIDGNQHADYALSQINGILPHVDIKSKSVLEIGPGGSYYLACLFLKNGAERVYVIDNENHNFFSEEEISLYKNLYPESIGKDKTINQDKITVLHYTKDETIPLSENSIDFIYSNAVLEHVFHPKQTIGECLRVLKNNGQMLHQIDYRDHIFHQQSLFFLKIPNFLFDLFYKNTGMWVNRLRHSHWITLFQSFNKIKIIFTKPQEAQPYSKKPKLMSKNDYMATGCLFLLQKYE